MKKVPALALALLGLVMACCQVQPGDGGSATATASEIEVAAGERIRGATFDSRADPGPGALHALADLGVTHVMLTPFAFQAALDTPGIRTNYHARWFTEGEAGIRRLAREARPLGLHIVLKPHVWMGRGAWSADIAMHDERDWQAWEAQYTAFALYYARLSEEIGAPLFVIGSELGTSVQARPHYWRGLIAQIRAVYNGKLTYAANWSDDYEKVAFWGDLDYVGVQAYFPLARTDGPQEVAALEQAWQPHLKALHRVSQASGRPVLFTEIGYRSVPYAAREPWRWPERGETTAADLVLQARLYEAFFEVVWPQPWLAGAAIWKLYPPSDRDHALDFTPQGKPAAEVLRKGFDAAPAESPTP